MTNASDDFADLVGQAPPRTREKTGRKPPPGRKFTKGHKIGRPKGVPNKITTELREMILGALEDVGGREYLARQAKKKNPQAFLALVGRLVPSEVHATQRVAITAGLDWKALLGGQDLELEAADVTVIEPLPLPAPEPAQELAPDPEVRARVA